MFTPHAQSAMSQQAHSGRPRLLPGGSLRRHGAAAFHGVACGGLHSHTPSSVAAAIATAARLVALRISRRTAVLAHVSCIKSSLTSLSMRSLSQAPKRGFNRGHHEIS